MVKLLECDCSQPMRLFIRHSSCIYRFFEICNLMRDALLRTHLLFPLFPFCTQFCIFVEYKPVSPSLNRSVWGTHRQEKKAIVENKSLFSNCYAFNQNLFITFSTPWHFDYFFFSVPSSSSSHSMQIKQIECNDTQIHTHNGYTFGYDK